MSTRLMVLGLLSRSPMHGYDIKRTMETSHTDEWAAILPGSVYHALNRMTEEGLVQVQATEATGHRTRAIYAITDKGRAEMLRLLRETWRTPSRPFPVIFYTAIAFFDDLPREEVREALAEKCRQLEEELELWARGGREKSAAGTLPEHLRLAFANAREHLEADLRLARALMALPARRSAERSPQSDGWSVGR